MSMGEPHVISSQAGLASFVATPKGGDPSFGQRITVKVDRPTLTVRTPSGVVFELRKQLHAAGYAVIGSIGRQSTTAEAIVGMVFVPGDSADWYAQGYAMVVQRELNAQMANIITEVPL